MKNGDQSMNGHELRQRHALERPHAEELRHVDRRGRPVGGPAVPAGGRVGHERRLLPALEILDVAGLGRAVGPHEGLRAVGLISFSTTPAAREASSTWTTAPEYLGAIFTAVCRAEVVAPPIRSGTESFSCSNSWATCTISSRLGVIRPLRAHDVDLRGEFASSMIFAQGTITPRSITS
jgi:hypothetical protein